VREPRERKRRHVAHDAEAYPIVATRRQGVRFSDHPVVAEQPGGGIEGPRDGGVRPHRAVRRDRFTRVDLGSPPTLVVISRTVLAESHVDTDVLEAAPLQRFPQPRGVRAERRHRGAVRGDQLDLDATVARDCTDLDSRVRPLCDPCVDSGFARRAADADVGQRRWRRDRGARDGGRPRTAGRRGRRFPHDFRRTRSWEPGDLEQSVGPRRETRGRQRFPAAIGLALGSGTNRLAFSGDTLAESAAGCRPPRVPRARPGIAGLGRPGGRTGSSRNRAGSRQHGRVIAPSRERLLARAVKGILPPVRQADQYVGKEILAGQFRVLERIGSGGMGAVYKAQQPSMDRFVAVKILHSKFTNRKDLVSRFRREARAMSHLTHPNTAKVFLYGQLEDGSCYIVMEHLEGKNLGQVVRHEGPMEAARGIGVLTQACAALEEAHQKGIVHRDLKPENIFLCNQGGIRDYVKVLDFGLAKVTEREMRPGSLILTQEGMVFGTPEFMSPEQAQGKVLDARSDIYSLAVILFELLTGKLPYDARSPMEYITLHVQATPKRLTERAPNVTFPAGLQEVLDRAMAKKPEDRFQTAADFASALRSVVDGSGAADRASWRPSGVAPVHSQSGSVRPAQRPDSIDAGSPTRELTSVAGASSPARDKRPPVALLVTLGIILGAVGAFLLLKLLQ